jgi:hypothetical protein
MSLNVPLTAPSQGDFFSQDVSAKNEIPRPRKAILK